ncbi:MAG: FAD-dependent monooxygenase, partial [Gammaproteobacteria bacterium]
MSELLQTLIVGAGPTGLILAHELLRRGIACRMIERRATPSGSTRAFTLHARTLEMFDHMGVVDRIDELREICPGNLFHFKEVPLGREQAPTLDFTRLRHTRYNYYGKVNQNDLDQALRDSLAAKYSFYPEYGVEYVASTAVAEGVQVTLRHTGDAAHLEQITTPWLIGADGAQSTVRAGLGGEFGGQSGHTMTMSMVDAALTGYRGDRAWVNYYVSARGFMLVTGLPGDIFRLYLAGELEQFLKDQTPAEAFQRGLDFFDTGAQIQRIDWSSSWEIRKIIGDTYRRDRTILC